MNKAWMPRSKADVLSGWCRVGVGSVSGEKFYFKENSLNESSSVTGTFKTDFVSVAFKNMKRIFLKLTI